MGVLNVTPDSFSDGGRYLDPDLAIAHGIELCTEGADLVDVGGESTRPGAEPTGLDEELARVVPVVRALTAAGVAVSIDTMNAVTARTAVEAGAAMVNDVSGGLADPDMLATVADLRVPYVCMHWRGPSSRMNELTGYADVVGDVVSALGARMAACERAGIDPARIVLDPGLGFAKEAEHNWELLRRLGEFDRLGRPLLVGASRKRFLGSLLATPDGTPRPTEGRDAATAAVSALAAAHGVWAVRVHAPRPSRDAVEVAAAWRD